ncbi:MAG: glycosyl transferase [Bacteroidetes bacterium GWF2_33_16]|nr:MAG: glycosyl transferase [Bacteroidetes bacterium GWE2_32_14]OFY03491.1 MAG: glycosyl transferase [Bacteroidetes bacterium GWF2_33_16]
MQNVKFLVIRFSSIGDIVLTTPVVRGLKKQVPNAEIHYLTKPQFKSLLENNPYIDKVHVLKSSFSKMIEELRDERFDYVIDLHHNLRTFRVKNKLKLLSFSFDKLNYEKWLYVNFKINKLPNIHIVDRYLKTLSLFDIVNDEQGLDYFIPEKDEVMLSDFPEIFRNGYIALVIGAFHNTKRLTSEKIISICKKADLPVILLGGPENRDEAEKIKSEIGEKSYNACGIYNINQSASLVKQCNVILTPDTGLMHIASSFKKKIVSIWGNTVPEFGMYPYHPHSESAIFEIKGLKCRPCSKIGFKECPKKHFKCINDMNEDVIAKKMVELYNR